MRSNLRRYQPDRSYSMRSSVARRRAMRRNILIVILLVVLVLAVVGIVVGFLIKNNMEREAQQLSYRQEGIAYYEQGEYEKALEAFQNALEDSLGKINELEMDTCFYKARTQYELGDKEGALETYNAVIAFNENPKAYFLRGNLYYSMEEEEKAIADYKKAVESESEDYDLYIAIYEILASKDQVEEGKKILEKAIEIKGNKLEDKIKKGRIHYLLGDAETAISLLEEAAEKDAEAYYYLFLVYDSMENDDKSLENLRIYMEKEADLDSVKLYEMGNSLLKKGMIDSAIECYQEALKLEKLPNKQEIMKNLIVAHERNKDFASAKEVMKQYIKEYPEDEEALRENTFLETR